jgi:PKD repeat protein
MKKIYKLILIFSAIGFHSITETSAQGGCNPEGNLFIFSNYDGGVLNINVDLDIPDIRIGIVSYVAVEVNFTGDFIGNITSVIYAGINSDNDNCSTGVLATSINGIDEGIYEILYAPEGTISEENGYPSIICGYSCGTEWQGGCNTSNEILNYFTTTLGGVVNTFKIQYECWQNEVIFSEVAGTCCEQFQSAPVAEIGVLSTSICVGDCIDYSDLSANLPTDWFWTFMGGSVDTISTQNPQGICYLEQGEFATSLEVTNEFGYSFEVVIITVGSAEVTNATITEVGDNLVADADGENLTYQWYTCGGGLNEIFGATDQTFTPFANGLYAVVVASNGCRDTSACTGFVLTSLNDFSRNDQFKIYPNPFKDGFYFEDFQSNFKNGELKLFNAVGETISVSIVNTDKIFISTENLASGLYYLELRSSDRNGFYKILKE